MIVLNGCIIDRKPVVDNLKNRLCPSRKKIDLVLKPDLPVFEVVSLGAYGFGMIFFAIPASRRDSVGLDYAGGQRASCID